MLTVCVQGTPKSLTLQTVTVAPATGRPELLSTVIPPVMIPPVCARSGKTKANRHTKSASAVLASFRRLFVFTYPSQKCRIPHMGGFILFVLAILAYKWADKVQKNCK